MSANKCEGSIRETDLAGLYAYQGRGAAMDVWVLIWSCWYDHGVSNTGFIHVQTTNRWAGQGSARLVRRSKHLNNGSSGLHISTVHFDLHFFHV